MILPLFPRLLMMPIAGLEEAKNLGGKILRLNSDPFSDVECGENLGR